MLAQGSYQLSAGTLRRAQKVAAVAALLWTGVESSGHEILGQGTFARNATCRIHRLKMRTDTDTATALRLVGPIDAERFPLASAWEAAPPIRFSRDWQGRNADPERATEVRALWASDTLFLRFDARYRTITVFPDGDANGRRDKLWDRDVCEVFLQSDSPGLDHYTEFEVAPNGFWIDLDIRPGAKRDLGSGLRRRVERDETNKRWRAVLALPMNSLVPHFDPSVEWRANFYRVEGTAEPRFYSAWRPTHTPQPNFHVPGAFGRLVFA